MKTSIPNGKIFDLHSPFRSKKMNPDAETLSKIFTVAAGNGDGGKSFWFDYHLSPNFAALTTAEKILFHREADRLLENSTDTHRRWMHLEAIRILETGYIPKWEHKPTLNETAIRGLTSGDSVFVKN